MAHCSTCLYDTVNSDEAFHTCNHCFAFSNYRKGNITTKEIREIIAPLTVEEEHMKLELENLLSPIEPAYVTYMGRTFKTNDINMRFGSLNDYTTFNIEFTNSPSNLVENFGPTPQIKDVIFNPPATIVFWGDDTKTVVRAQDGEKFDPEKGLAMAISKKILGNKYDYYHTFARYLKKWDKRQGVK